LNIYIYVVLFISKVIFFKCLWQVCHAITANHTEAEGIHVIIKIPIFLLTAYDANLN